MEGGHCQRRGDPRIEVLGQDYLSNAGGMSGGGAGGAIGRKSIKDVGGGGGGLASRGGGVCGGGEGGGFGGRDPDGWGRGN